MTDTKLLRDKISESGYKLAFIAQRLSLTYPSLLARTKGEVEFKVSEVRILKELLNLSDEEVGKIFY